MKIGTWSYGYLPEPGRAFDAYEPYRGGRIHSQQCFFLLHDRDVFQIREDTVSLCGKTGIQGRQFIDNGSPSLAAPTASQCLQCWRVLTEIVGTLARQEPIHPRVVVYRRALASLAVDVNGRPCFCAIDARLAALPQCPPFPLPDHLPKCRELRALLEQPHPADLVGDGAPRLGAERP